MSKSWYFIQTFVGYEQKIEQTIRVMLEKGELEVMTLEDYVEVVCDQLELLPPDTVIERVTGDGARDTLLAPEWSLKKLVVQNEIDKLLFERNSYQGIRFSK